MSVQPGPEVVRSHSRAAPTTYDDRRAKHGAVAAHLSALSDEEVLALPREGGPRSVWSTTGTIQVDAMPVFIKRVPVTALEAGHPYSTGNHFGLPNCYHYGVGSAGYGAFRELAGLVQTTAMVLDGSAAGFPLLYHHRILPGSPRPWTGRMTLEAYVEYWAGDQAIDRYMRARQVAPQELWMFLEYFPRAGDDWFGSHQAEIPRMIAHLCGAAAELRRHGLVHFDAHFGNVVTDGALAVLADFGLVCADTFELGAGEAEFLDNHRYYDVGLVLANLGLFLTFEASRATPETRTEIDRRCGIGAGSGRLQVIMGLVDRAEDLADVLGLDAAYLTELERYREVNRYMHAFVSEMQSRPAKDACYSDKELLARLRDAGTPFTD